MTQLSSTNMSQLSVAILGSGIGGLTLGRCLRQKGISAVIYERASSAPRHTYGITLDSSAYRPLLKVLDIDEHAFRRRVAVDSLHSNGTGKVFAGQQGDDQSMFRANRNKLESMLREGQTIELEHTINSATLLEDGRGIELKFANDTKLRSSLVVDTTGVHSKLRSSLLPDISPEVLPYAVYNSKRYVKAEHFNEIYASAFENGNCITWEPRRAGDPRLEVTVNDHLPEGKISISYTYSRPSRGSSPPDPLHNPARPTAGATDIPEEFYEELEAFVKERGLQEPYREVFDSEQIRTERLLHWLMRTILVPEEDLQRLLGSGTIILGDAAHAVPILGGWGANLAMSDAIDLAEVIGKSGTEQEPLAAFYREHYPKWASEVEKSKASIAEMHAPAKASL